ncbi:MAG: hypothetical protein K0V04_02760, partial [Deltaproteobacteria bacterium]|nr:hypothetical protein [Deltaproteobacteria bacterium]
VQAWVCMARCLAADARDEQALDLAERAWQTGTTAELDGPEMAYAAMTLAELRTRRGDATTVDPLLARVRQEIARSRRAMPQLVRRADALDRAQ